MKVSGAFHTPFMTPARDRLRKALAEVEFRQLDIPVVANVDATAHDDAGDWPGLLTAQLCSPVRWRQTLHTLTDQGIRTFVELGPGTVLSGTIKRTLDGARALAVNTPDDLDTLLERVEGEAAAAHHEGEHLFMTERVVVSPAAGLFAPVADLDAGRPDRGRRPARDRRRSRGAVAVLGTHRGRPRPPGRTGDVPSTNCMAPDR